MLSRPVRLQHLVGSSFGRVAIGSSKRARHLIRQNGSCSDRAISILSVVTLEYVDMWWAHLSYSVVFIIVCKVAQHVRTALLLNLRFVLTLTIFLLWNDFSTELAFIDIVVRLVRRFYFNFCVK